MDRLKPIHQLPALRTVAGPTLAPVSIAIQCWVVLPNHYYVPRWQDWPFSSAAAFLQQIGRDEAEALWKEYPIGEYGRGWDG